MKTYFRIFRYAPRLTPRLVIFIVFAVLSVVFSTARLALVIPMLRVLFDDELINAQVTEPSFAWSVEYAVGLFNYHMVTIAKTHGVRDALLFVIGGLFISTLFTSTFTYVERMTAMGIKVDVVKNLRMHIFERISLLHIGFFNNQRKGDLISRFTNDVQEVEVTIINAMKFVMKEPIVIVAYFSALFLISAKLTLFTLIVLPVTGAIIGQIVRKLRKKARASQESLGRIINILDETLSGMRVINAFNARGFILGKIDQETNLHRKLNLSISRKNELSSPLSELMGIGVIAIVIYYAAGLVLDTQELDSEQLIGFLAIYANILQPMKNLSNGVTSLQKGTASAGRIFSVIETESEIRNKPDAVALDEFKSDIEFVDVSFSYGQHEVLKNINLRIQKGKTVALVGPSGGGKSTLADLVPRFYDPTSGEVRVDGKALTDYEVESIRKHMGIVTQESILFNDTIFNNIAFGMKDVREEDVIHAAKVANAHEFIEKTEHGYQTLIGERGGKLSGGQRQRLSIARAVLKNPPILILDEATSALDSESERLVQDALFNLMQNRTSIVIAHRLSTIQHADEIIVIQDGRIAERGTHDDLIQQKGLYRKLSEIQKA